MLFSWLLWIWRVLRCCCDATSIARAMATLFLQLRRDFSRWFFSSAFIVTIVHVEESTEASARTSAAASGSASGGAF
jgi:hypothetical protein